MHLLDLVLLCNVMCWCLVPAAGMQFGHAALYNNNQGVIPEHSPSLPPGMSPADLDHRTRY